MSTEETMLAIESLRRDLDRWRDHVTDMVLGDAKRIKARMADTAAEAIKADTPHDQVMEIIAIMNEVNS